MPSPESSATTRKVSFVDLTADSPPDAKDFHSSASPRQHPEARVISVGTPCPVVPISTRPLPSHSHSTSLRTESITYPKLPKASRREDDLLPTSEAKLLEIEPRGSGFRTYSPSEQHRDNDVVPDGEHDILSAISRSKYTAVLQLQNDSPSGPSGKEVQSL